MNADTRDKIVRTAMELFWAKGYQSTSIADILSRSQVHSGSLYHFFPGKQHVLAALSAFVLGGLWYGPLFGKAWLRLNGKPEDQPMEGHPAKIFGGSFVLSLISAFVFAMFVGRDAGLAFGASVGVAAGLGWVATSYGINYLFADRKLGLWLVDGGYHTLQFTLYGALLGRWGRVQALGSSTGACRRR